MWILSLLCYNHLWWTVQTNEEERLYLSFWVIINIFLILLLNLYMACSVMILLCAVWLILNFYYVCYYSKNLSIFMCYKLLCFSLVKEITCGTQVLAQFLWYKKNIWYHYVEVTQKAKSSSTLYHLIWTCDVLIIPVALKFFHSSYSRQYVITSELLKYIQFIRKFLMVWLRAVHKFISDENATNKQERISHIKILFSI